MSSYLAIKELAALVKAKRGKRGLREVAKEIGDISPSTLSRIEAGKMPDLDTFIQLCNWLEIKPDEFFSSSTPQEDHNLPVTSGMSTPEIIEAHLRADRELDPDTAEALADMVKAAYNAIHAGKLGQKK
jgi:transcriptional regulator with XRE-family HTH domain